MSQLIVRNAGKRKNILHVRKSLVNHWRLYIFVGIPFIFLLLFAFVPMYGILIAFQNFKLTRGIWGSRWVGLKYFERFFASKSCFSIISNTLIISLESIIIGFPFPILLALMLNEVGNEKYKKTVQTTLWN